MKRTAGVTLMEMLVVMALVSLMAGITYPSVSAGMDTLRLTSATNQLVGFLNSALNRAERRQHVVELTVTGDRLQLRSAEPGFLRELTLENGIRIVKIFPEAPADEEGPRRFYLYPGGTPPRAGFLLRGQKGAGRIVRIDPMTGVSRIESPEEHQP